MLVKDKCKDSGVAPLKLSNQDLSYCIESGALEEKLQEFVKLCEGLYSTFFIVHNVMSFFCRCRNKQSEIDINAGCLCSKGWGMVCETQFRRTIYFLS